MPGERRVRGYIERYFRIAIAAAKLPSPIEQRSHRLAVQTTVPVRTTLSMTDGRRHRESSLVFSGCAYDADMKGSQRSCWQRHASAIETSRLLARSGKQQKQSTGLFVAESAKKS